MTTILPAELAPLVVAGAEALLDERHAAAVSATTAYASAAAVLEAVLDHPAAGELLGAELDTDTPVPYRLTCKAYAELGLEQRWPVSSDWHGPPSAPQTNSVTGRGPDTPATPSIAATT